MIAENNFKMDKTKTYISGKTTGIPIEKINNKFEVAECYLLSNGMVPVSPLKNGLDVSHSKKEHFQKNIDLLLSSDRIFVLDNWIDSKQSMIDIRIAEEHGLPIIFESNSFKNIGKIDELKAAINEVLGLKFDDYITDSRNQKLFTARMIFINHCRNQENMNLQDIAALINRGHATVLHGIKTYKNEIRYNSDFRKKVMKINSILKISVSE
jgi:hypothetical protein